MRCDAASKPGQRAVARWACRRSELRAEGSNQDPAVPNTLVSGEHPPLGPIDSALLLVLDIGRAGAVWICDDDIHRR